MTLTTKVMAAHIACLTCFKVDIDACLKNPKLDLEVVYISVLCSFLALKVLFST